MTVPFALLLAFLAATAPGGPRPTDSPRIPAGGRSIRGAVHIHTTRSDGAAGKRDVAAAAARAGLQFAVFSDHGDGTRAPDPPEYIDGVLCVDGVEISTADGHYVAIGMRQAPYRLGGEAAAVAEDVARLGGIGIAAHPHSSRPELAWRDWNVPVDGLEWLNADSEWRDESRLRLSRVAFDYWWRPSGALATLLDRPHESLSTFDDLSRRRPVLALAAHDAHGGFGPERGGGRGRRVPIPSYEASFRTFSLGVELDTAPTGDAARDARALLDALRERRVYTAIDALAAPAALEFSAQTASTTARTGDVLPMSGGPARFVARAAAPQGAIMLLLRDGSPIAARGGGILDQAASLPGAYRVEIHVQKAPGTPPVPWLVSNAIYRFADDSPPSSPEAGGEEAVAVEPVAHAAWRVEAGPGSSGTLAAGGAAGTLTYRLAPGERSSQFAALVTDISGLPSDASALTFAARADRPTRISTQVRFGQDQGARWTRSAYLDTRERAVTIPLDALRSPGGAVPRPPLDRAAALLFVVDLTNAEPGAGGTFIIADLKVRRPLPRGGR